MLGKLMISLPLGRGGRLLLRYKLSTPRGVVAQLGERRVRNAKVGSSILLGSTIDHAWLISLAFRRSKVP